VPRGERRRFETAPNGANIVCTMTSRLSAGVFFLGLSALAAACGARSSLEVDDLGFAGSTGSAGSAGSGGMISCEDGDTLVCGSDVGICKTGLQVCQHSVFGPCEGEIGPVEEQCNGLDDNCDGLTDEPFGLGAACDGADSDLCLDDVMTCDGCSLGPDILEICNGFDDDCDGIIDSDCEIGDCQPTLEVTGSTPSSPSCIDFPVTAGSTGTIHYPCAGGPVTATLGAIEFTGSVVNGEVSLDGQATVLGPDNCWWLTSHHIGGQISSGHLSYYYAEQLLTPDWPFCWSPCTETGEVAVTWEAL
jgi:hypothetical protein